MRLVWCFFFFHLCRVTELKNHSNHFFLCFNQDSYGMAVSWFPVISTFHQKGHLPDRCGLHDGMTLTFKPRLTENSTRVIDAIQARESEGLLRQVLQQFLHPLDKRRELIWILLCKSFINLQGLFKCLPRILW